jgi:hypothetical protein
VITASAAAAKLVLKEEGKPVAAGAELGLEVETSFSFGECKVAQTAHLSVISPRKDNIRIERLKPAACPTPEGSYISLGLRGGVKDILLSDGGNASLRAWPMQIGAGKIAGPGPECFYDFRKFSGAFPIPGQAVIGGSATGTLNNRYSRPGDLGEPCPQSTPTSFAIAVTGHNGKPLETELMTHH